MTSPPSNQPRTDPPPPVPRAPLEAEPPAPRAWTATLLPAYLGVVTWFPWLDALGAASGGAHNSLGRYPACLLALIAAYALLYLPIASLGLRRRGRSARPAANAFGDAGAEWIAGVLYGLFAAVWGSVAIAYSVRLILLGLQSWGLVDSSALRPSTSGGLFAEGPLVLIALAFWTFIIVSANGLNLMGVIAAMMRVYAPFAGLLLVVLAAWVWWKAPSDALTAGTNERAASGLDAATFQYVFGILAFAGLAALEWGAAVRDRRDVRIGGWLGLLAPGAIASLAALALASRGTDGTIRSVLASGAAGTLPPAVRGGALLLFGLAALAPACYASALFHRRFRGHWPALVRWRGVALSGLVFWIPGATGLAWRLDDLATIAGALFAPACAVLAADGLLDRRTAIARPGSGWRVSGIAAWIFGVAVGLTPIMGRMLQVGSLASIQPAALYAYLVAGACHLVLGRTAERRGDEATSGRVVEAGS